MIPGRIRHKPSERVLECETVLFGSPTHERLMLLELAADLQSWAARNVVFEKALQRAAQDLARLASEMPPP